MTSKEALKELNDRPLVFGDEKQIAAVRFIESVEAAKEAVSKCKRKHKASDVCRVCDGYGTHTCPECDGEHDCEECDGSGTLSRVNVRECVCLSSYRQDVQDEVLVWMREQAKPQILRASGF